LLSNKNQRFCLFDLYKKLKAETGAAFIRVDYRVLDLAIF